MTTAIETKERPILFSGEMVRAILDGRKTQTRRIVKMPLDANGVTPSDCGNGTWQMSKWIDDDFHCKFVKCPYGQPGDNLWVRETWQKSGIGWGNSLKAGKLHYRATDNGEWKDYWGKWKPSIHMPRWVSRITLEITSIRVEMLQEISEQDAIAEGILPVGSCWFNYGKDADEPFIGDDAAVSSYRTLWESINGKGSWALNPWVWVVEFKRVIAD